MSSHSITTAHWQKLLWVSASESAFVRRRKIKTENGEKIVNYLNSIYPCWGRITDFYQFLDIKKTKVKDGGRTTLRRELFILIEQKKIETEIKKTKTGRHRRYRVLK